MSENKHGHGEKECRCESLLWGHEAGCPFAMSANHDDEDENPGGFSYLADMIRPPDTNPCLDFETDASLLLSPEWKRRLGALRPDFRMLVRGGDLWGRLDLLLPIAAEVSRHGPVLYANGLLSQHYAPSRHGLHDGKINFLYTSSKTRVLAKAKEIGALFLFLEGFRVSPDMLARSPSPISNGEFDQFGVCVSLQNLGSSVREHWMWMDLVVEAKGGMASVRKSRYGNFVSWPIGSPDASGPASTSPCSVQ